MDQRESQAVAAIERNWDREFDRRHNVPDALPMIDRVKAAIHACASIMSSSPLTAAADMVEHSVDKPECVRKLLDAVYLAAREKPDLETIGLLICDYYKHAAEHYAEVLEERESEGLFSHFTNEVSE